MADLRERPSEGCYIYGLYLEGAGWDKTTMQLAEARPKELYTEMAVIWLFPVAERKPPVSGTYLCPIYKTLTRAGKKTVEYLSVEDLLSYDVVFIDSSFS